MLNLPKQASPIQRTLSPTFKSSQQNGVAPSITRRDIEDFREGIRLGQGIVEDLIRPVPNILRTFLPLAGLF